MVDTDKPEVVMGPGDDILHGHLLEPLASLGQEPHPPRQEKQPPQHSSSSNEKSELKEKSTGNKKASRFHTYSKEKNSGSGEKKGPNPNRVFIKFINTSKSSYTMITLGLFKGCKDSSIYTNQCDIPC
uniref:Uncharacterized protein n=1 Tax=Capra hircus TaxID=9925 RepID=A0A8C2SF01_CAPHI